MLDVAKLGQHQPLCWTRCLLGFFPGSWGFVGLLVEETGSEWSPSPDAGQQKYGGVEAKKQKTPDRRKRPTLSRHNFEHIPREWSSIPQKKWRKILSRKDIERVAVWEWRCLVFRTVGGPLKKVSSRNDVRSE